MNRIINLQLKDLTGKTVQFKGLREFLEFVKYEADFWGERKLAVSSGAGVHPALSFHAVMDQVIAVIEGWSDQIDSWDDSRFHQMMSNLHQQKFQQAHVNWLWSGHPFVTPFIDCHKDHGQAVATAFLDYVANKRIGNMGIHDVFHGVMIGYEFENQDSSLLKRRNGEKISLGQLRSRLEEATGKLFGEVEEFRDGFDSWDTDSRENWKTWMEEASLSRDTQQDQHDNDFKSYMDGCATRISELENTYQEKLRLEKPAEYWSKAARKFGIQGGMWVLALIAAVGTGIYYFSGFFTEWLQGQAAIVKLNTVQGIVIFGSVVALYAFLVRTLSRLTFSSFHLMRDAEERELLTYLYLSLINEKKIDEGSRDLVLQALFSRSETGLLGSESGPTMPSVSEIIRSVPKIT